jgi:hypothetical protein
VNKEDKDKLIKLLENAKYLQDCERDRDMGWTSRSSYEAHYAINDALIAEYENALTKLRENHD